MATSAASAPATTTTEQASARKRVRKTGRKPGKVSWVHGTKEVFFRTRAEDWQTAKRLSQEKVSKFYDDITNLYIQKYGYDMKDDEDLEEDVPDPTDPNAQSADVLDKEEADHRTAISESIRGRIGQWYRLNYGDGAEQGKNNLFQDLLSGGQDVADGSKRGKSQAWQFYSKLYYKERVKKIFEEEWRVQTQRAKDLGLDPPADVKKVRAWEIGRAEVPSTTKEEMIGALNNAGHYLQPIADTIHARFGMNVVIMLAGPIGDQGGTMGVRSVHAGKTKGLNARAWYEFDRLGYHEAEKSMIRFSEKCYTAEECRSRVVDKLGDSEGGSSQGAGQTIAAAGAINADVGHGQLFPPRPAGTGTLLPRANVPQDGAIPDGASSSATPNASSEGAGGTTIPNAILDGAGGTITLDASSDGAGSTTTPTANPEGNSGGGEEAQGDGAPRTHSGDGVPPDNTVPRPRAVVDEDEEDEITGEGAWNRTDKAKWPNELRNAYTAFALGEKWGGDWLMLVKAYMDFEAVCGYQDTGPRFDGKDKPAEVAAWIKSGRKWGSSPKLENLGKLGQKGSFVDNCHLNEFGWVEVHRQGRTDSGWASAVGCVEHVLRHFVQENLAQPPPGDEEKAPQRRGTKRKRQSGGGEEEDEEGGGKRRTRKSANDGPPAKSRSVTRSKGENVTWPYHLT
ncbi:hypothetical protein B0H14DRAFT_2628964 [Mycena olivaceomarginata]|nr:hypothetical protein B0H14DRAFT_2628964 [Mycena olivaceomarginata]